MVLILFYMALYSFCMDSIRFLCGFIWFCQWDRPKGIYHGDAMGIGPTMTERNQEEWRFDIMEIDYSWKTIPKLTGFMRVHHQLNMEICCIGTLHKQGIQLLYNDCNDMNRSIMENSASIMECMVILEKWGTYQLHVNHQWRYLLCVKRWRFSWNNHGIWKMQFQHRWCEWFLKMGLCRIQSMCIYIYVHMYVCVGTCTFNILQYIYI